MVGSRISHYLIQAQLGQGGMGVVYQATDTRLDRTVALKFLPAHSLPTDDDKARFVREAKAAARLNHPNIAHVYEIDETDDGKAFIAMEYVEGQTLAEQIQRGPLKLGEAVEIAKQVAKGLQVAHEAGIVHRDVKSSNVMLSEKGQVKIMDFGLAKTEAATLLTQEGTALGTIAYMSPEQARGEAVDHRSDIWSLGVVLYEMISGQRPFRGDYEQAVIYSILNEDPEALTGLRTGVPVALERVVEKCLSKDPALRYQHVDEVAVDLRAIDLSKAPPAPSTPHQPGSPLKSVLRMAAVFAVGLLCGLMLGWGLFSSRLQAPPVRHQQMTANPTDNMVSGAAISRDGTLLAFTDTVGIQIRVLETGETSLVPGTRGRHLWEVSWFPGNTRLLATGPSEDGMQLSLYAVSVLGGTLRKLRDHGRRGVVSPDGSQILFLDASTPSREVWVMAADGSNARPVVSSPSRSFWQVAWSPDGTRILYGVFDLGRQEGPISYIESYDLVTGATSIVLEDDRLFQHWRAVLPFAWTPDDHLICALRDPPPNQSYSNLWKFAIDPRAVRVKGTPTRLTNLIGVNFENLQLDDAGRQLTYLRQFNQQDVYVGTFTEGGQALVSIERLTYDEREDSPTAWSIDGQHAIFISNRSGVSRIYQQRVDEASVREVGGGVTDLAGIDPELLVPHSAQVGPDGTWLLYFDQVVHELRRVPLEGGAPEVILSLEGGESQFRCAPGSGRPCVLSRIEEDEIVFYVLDPLGGIGEELTRRRVERAIFVNWALSLSGTHVALVNFSNTVQIVPLDGSAGTDLVVAGWSGFEFITWAPGDRGVVVNAFSPRGPFWARGALLYVGLDGTFHTLHDKHNEWNVYQHTSPDGRRLAFSAMIYDSNAWMIKDF